jgi:hypothetical protein
MATNLSIDDILEHCNKDDNGFMEILFPIEIFIFEGACGLSKDDCTVIKEWNKETLLKIFASYMKGYRLEDENERQNWLNSKVNFFTEETTIKDTFQMISNNIAQIIKDPQDGGHIWIVRK